MADDDVWSDTEDVEVVEEPVETPKDDVIQYTDPAGNTFEAPVVDEFVSDEDEDKVLDAMFTPVAPERVKFAVDNTEEEQLSIEPTPADYELLEAMESSEGTEAVADLDSIPVEKEEEPEIDTSFDLDFSDNDNEDGDEIPDFF